MSFPSSPLDIQTTKDLLQRRIEAGEIDQSDIDILKRGYRWMIVSTTIGAAVGIPVYIVMGKRKPPLPIWTKLAFTSFAASSMSFLGFTVGGAAAALEVNTQMKDSQRKMKVFQQVMIDSKRAVEAERLGLPRPDGIGGRRPTDLQKEAGAAAAGNWDAGADEQRSELERERDLQRAQQARGQDSRDVRASSTSSTSSNPTSSWDRLRMESIGSGRPKPAVESIDNKSPPPRPQTLAPVGRPDDQNSYDRVDAEDREREKREFEALLDRERHAGESEATSGMVWR